MQNLVAFLVFQITSLGIFSLISPFIKVPLTKNTAGMAVFWGFWGSMILTCFVSVIVPNHLNISFYFIFLLSLCGITRLFYERQSSSFINSKYSYCLLFLLPFIYFLIHSSSSWDEFSYWVLLPKIYLETNELATAALPSGIGYTPLWTLQAAFFENLSPGPFNESVLATVKIGLFVSFIFFLKEILNIKNFTFFLFSFLLLFLSSKVNKHLLIEFPLFILITSLCFLVYAFEREEKKEVLYFLLMGMLSLYLVKKSMVAILPPVLWYVWIKGYKKELFSFLAVFILVVVGWKLKTYHLSELLCPNCTIGSFSSPEAFQVYSVFLVRIKAYFLYFLLFGGSLYVMYKNSRKLFIFYGLFSLIFLTAVLISYLFSFSKDEALQLASFIRYLTSVFYPAYTVALYFLISKISDKIEARAMKFGRLGGVVRFALLSIIIGGSFYYHGYKESKKDEIGPFVAKMDTAFLHRGKGLIIGLDMFSYDYVQYRYHLYPMIQKLESYPLDKLPKQELNEIFRNYDLIVVVDSNPILNEFLKVQWGMDPMGSTQFYLRRINNKVELKKL